DDRTLATARDLIRELSGMASLVTGDDPSPSVGAVFVNADAVRLALERARRLADERWPAVVAALEPVLDEAALKRPSTLHELRQLCESLVVVKDFLAECRPSIFDSDLERLSRELAPARSRARALWAWAFNGAFRAALKEVRTHQIQPSSAAKALDLIERAKR